MTLIKKLKLKGFKSFASPTELDFGNGFNCIIGSNGSGKCVLGDTLVQLANGSLIKIQDLVHNRLENNSIKTEDGFIAHGDNTKILALDLKELKIKSKNIQAYVKRRSPEKLIKITTRSGRNITTTKYHPLFILKDGKVIAAKAEDLKEKTRIAVPRKLMTVQKTKYFIELLDLINLEDRIYVPYNEKFKQILLLNKNKRTWKRFAEELGVSYLTLKSLADKQAINFVYLVKILRALKFNDFEIIKLIDRIKSSGHPTYKMLWENSKEFSRFFGYFMAEGCIPKVSDQVRLSNSCKEIIEDYKNLSKKLFDVNVTVNNYKGNAYDLLFYSEPIRKILNKFGAPFGYVDFKEITNLFLSHSSDEELAEFINGFFCGDGYVGKSCLEISTKSKKLGFNIENILLRLGITFSSKWKIKIAANSKTRASGVYRIITIYNVENFKIFNNKIKLIHNEKREKLLKLINLKSNPNVDIIEANILVKDTAKESKINIKKLSIAYPKLKAYVYNDCLTTRNGLNQLINKVFPTQIASENLIQLNKLANSDIFWDEVLEIEEIDSKEEWVYDLCVEKDHNFIANNIIVHNTNIMDGMVFVLGELSAKSIRAEKSSNLIFNGGKKGSPMKEAEVSVFFDNDKKEFPIDSDEVKLSRFVRSNGQSIYKINDEKRTRQQVLELIKAAKIDPAGHNIVMQGDIIHFADMRPEDRRGIIEEISGISVYEDRKEKALSELNKVDSKLNESGIILTEREVHLRELKKERDQALKFKELEDNLKNNKATLLNFQIKEKQDRKDEVESKISKQQQEADIINKKISEIENQIKSKKESLTELNKKIEEKGEKEQIAIQKEIEHLKTRLVEDKTKIENYSGEIQKIKGRIVQLKQNHEEISSKITSINKNKKVIEEKNSSLQKEESKLSQEIENFKKTHNITENLNLDKLEKEIEKEQNNIFKLKEERGSLNLDREKLELEIDRINTILNIENRKEIKDLRENYKKISKLVDQKTGENSLVANELSGLRTKLTIKNEELIRLKAKDISIKETLSSDLSLKKILSMKIQDVYGTVADLGKVDSKYTTSLEVAAGSRINSLVVKDDYVAEKCINILKENKLGVAAFLPLNKIKERSARPEIKNLLNSKGVHGLAVELISFDKKFKNIFSHVFSDTLIVDDINTARKLGIGRARMVTLEGDLFEQSGAIIGGFRSKRFSMFKEKQYDANINSLENDISDLKKSSESLQNKKNSLDEEISKLRGKKAELEAGIIMFERTHNISDINDIKEKKEKISAELKEINSELKQIDSEINNSAKNLDSLKLDREKSKEKEKSGRMQQVLGKLKEIEESKEKVRIEIAKNETEIKNLLAQVNTIYVPEQEKISKIIKDHEKEIIIFTDQFNKLKSGIESNSKDLKSKEKNEKEFFSEYKSLFSKRNSLNESLQRDDNLISKEAYKLKEIESRINEISLKKAKVIAELEALEKEFSQFEQPKIRRGIDAEQLRTEIYNFDRELKKIGNVNLRALEVYESIEKEYQKLLEKIDIIKKEKDEILKLMYEIEGKKISIFMKTFKVIDENFRRIFLSLSEKGEAYLEIENKDDPLNSGIDIKVKLAGNKHLDIKSLSGGEKTMTALAMIFAIQEVRPASFYLLDEIDAALDKTNSVMLSNLLMKYSKTAQYILISHNDSIITEANQVYGISMQKNGVSKVTSLKL